jgi:hypothetical protein
MMYFNTETIKLLYMTLIYLNIKSIQKHDSSLIFSNGDVDKTYWCEAKRDYKWTKFCHRSVI